MIACGDDGGGEDPPGSGEPNGVDVGARVIDITPERFFPEGVTVDKDGNFYIGSMDLGSIYRATPSSAQAEPFIAPSAENGLVSVIGLFADDASGTLYVCSSDAGNGSRAGMAPAAIKSFEISTGDFIASYAWPAFSGEALPEDVTNGVTGFCNDMAMDARGNLYATDDRRRPTRRHGARRARCEWRRSGAPGEHWARWYRHVCAA
jgi:sugar lactone lactonase YvrE